jgi:UDP-3-O-[3-hydroxymyristoyl] glucosamine N-acyltransferase
VGDPAVFSLRLGAIIQAIGGELIGDPDTVVEALAPLDRAQARQICFLSNPRYAAALPACPAACVIVAPPMRDAALARGATIVVPDPYLYYAKLTQFWRRQHGLWRGDESVGTGGWVHPSAVVHPEAQVHPSARIGPLCVVERGARVGANSELTSRVSLGYDCVLGERCIVHPGVVIGADGFGFAKDGERWEKIEQLGAVWIGNDVEIGANTCVDRGALSDTVIEDGVKLDNLIQIGHNVRIGRNTAIAGSVAVAGSATIGANCTVGGGSLVSGHLTIVDGVHLSGCSCVSKSITKPGVYTGVFPLDEHGDWERNAATLRQLHRLRERIRLLERERQA